MMKWHRLQRFFLILLTISLIMSGRTALAKAADFSATLLLAQNGDTDAQYTLGGIYAKGQDTDKDVKRAAFWYLRAAMGDHADAQYQLGMLYEAGTGVAQSYTQALTWYRKAAYQGHQTAQAQREKILDHIDSLKHSADKGEVKAQCQLGDMYSKGNGVRHDDEQAVKWYRKAAEQGSATGQFNLGLMVAEGRGVPQDDLEAITWYRKAAEQGDADAEYYLSTMYYKGTGTPADAVTAYAWLNLAAAQGHEIATANKAFAASRLTAGQLKQAETIAQKLQAKITNTR